MNEFKTSQGYDSLTSRLESVGAIILGLFSFSPFTAQSAGRAGLAFNALPSGTAGGAIMPLDLEMAMNGALGALEDHSDPNARLAVGKAGAVY